MDGVKFRRQQPVGPFTVDVYSSDYRPVIEVDGSVHDFQFHPDQERQTMLETLGMNIFRVRAEHVERDFTAVLDQIRMKIGELKSSHDNFPSPTLDEGQGRDS